MPEELEGNCLIAQSGGPTSVINASLAGAVAEALNHECIEEIYGGLNGVLGILNGSLLTSPPSRAKYSWPSTYSRCRPGHPPLQAQKASRL